MVETFVAFISVLVCFMGTEFFNGDFLLVDMFIVFFIATKLLKLGFVVDDAFNDKVCQIKY